MKTCCRCKNTPPLSAFGADASRHDGLSPRCLRCAGELRKASTLRLTATVSGDADFRQRHRSYSKKWFDRNKNTAQFLERAAAHRRACRERNPLIRVVSRLRARKTVISMAEARELFKSKNCHYCLIPLANTVGNIDHRIPLSRGGHGNISNLVRTCRDCNGLKFTRTEEEFKLFLQEYLKRFRA